MLDNFAVLLLGKPSVFLQSDQRVDLSRLVVVPVIRTDDERILASVPDHRVQVVVCFAGHEDVETFERILGDCSALARRPPTLQVLDQIGYSLRRGLGEMKSQRRKLGGNFTHEQRVACAKDCESETPEPVVVALRK